MTFPMIELHVHLAGTVRAGTLLQIARRNEVPLPADSVEGLAAPHEFRDFAHFLEVWLLTTGRPARHSTAAGSHDRFGADVAGRGPAAGPGQAAAVGGLR